MIGEKIKATIEFDIPEKPDRRFTGDGFEVKGRHIKYTEEFPADEVLFNPEEDWAEKTSMCRLATVMCRNSHCSDLYDGDLDHDGEDDDFYIYAEDYKPDEDTETEDVDVYCDTYEDFLIRGADVSFMYETLDCDEAWELCGDGDKEEFCDRWPCKCVDAKRHISISLEENGRKLTRTDLVNGYYGNKYMKMYDETDDEDRRYTALESACNHDCARALFTRWERDKDKPYYNRLDLSKALGQNYVPAILCKAREIAYDEDGVFKTRMKTKDAKEAFALYDKAAECGSVEGMYETATIRKLCMGYANFEDAERRYIKAAEMAEKEGNDLVAAKCYLSLACYDRDDSCGLITTQFTNRAKRQPYLDKLNEKMKALGMESASDLHERYLNLTISRRAPERDDGKGGK